MKAKQFYFKFKTRIILLMCFLILSCYENATPYVADSEIAEINSKPGIVNFEVEQKSKLQALPKDLKIIKSARVKYKVNSVKSSTHVFKSLITNYQGYVSDLKFQNDSYRKENTFTIKIPAEHFDTIIDSIGKQVEFIDFEEVSTKDVSEEYIDISKRLKTKIEVRDRYETILRKKAQTVEDIVKVEEKLRRIQEEIESAQGRLNYFNNKIAYSTIHISLYETVTYKETPETYEKGFVSKAKLGLNFGWNLIETLFVSLIYVWPFVLLVILFIVLRKKRIRRLFK